MEEKFGAFLKRKIKEVKMENENFEELIKTIKTEPEKVEMLANEDPDYELVSDGEATLSFIPPNEETGLGPDVFTLSLSNGGGFSSVWVTKDEWKEIKQKIDRWLGV